MKVASSSPDEEIVRAGTLGTDSKGKMVRKKMMVSRLSAEELRMTVRSRKLRMYLGRSLFNDSHAPYIASEKNFF